MIDEFKPSMFIFLHISFSPLKISFNRVLINLMDRGKKGYC